MSQRRRAPVTLLPRPRSVHLRWLGASA
jgi:hypothetical protein